MFRCRWTLPLSLFDTSGWVAREEEVSVYTLLHRFHRWLDVSAEVHNRQTLKKNRTCLDVVRFAAASSSLRRRPAESSLRVLFHSCLFTLCFLFFLSRLFAVERFLSMNTGRLCLACSQWCNTCHHFVIAFTHLFRIVIPFACVLCYPFSKLLSLQLFLCGCCQSQYFLSCGAGFFLCLLSFLFILDSLSLSLLLVLNSR